MKVPCISEKYPWRWARKTTCSAITRDPTWFRHHTVEGEKRDLWTRGSCLGTGLSQTWRSDKAVRWGCQPGWTRRSQRRSWTASSRSSGGPWTWMHLGRQCVVCSYRHLWRSCIAEMIRLRREQTVESVGRCTLNWRDQTTYDGSTTLKRRRPAFFERLDEGREWSYGANECNVDCMRQYYTYC